MTKTNDNLLILDCENNETAARTEFNYMLRRHFGKEIFSWTDVTGVLAELLKQSIQCGTVEVVGMLEFKLSTENPFPEMEEVEED